MKYLYIISFIFYFLEMRQVCNAQRLTIDSLKKLIKLQEQKSGFEKDTNYINLLNELAYAYFNTNVDSMQIWAEKSLKTAQKIKFMFGESRGLRRLGYAYQLKGDYPRALQNYQKALNIAEKLKNKSLIALALTNIASIYTSREDVKTAFYYNKQALKLLEDIKDTQWLPYSLVNVGDYYEFKNQNDLALPYYKRAFEVAKSIHNKQVMAFSRNLIGNILNKQGKSDTAIICFQMSLKYYQQVQDKLGLVDTYRFLAESYFNTKNIDLALEYALRSFELAQEIEIPTSIKVSASTLYLIYKTKKDYVNALKYHELFKSYTDSLFKKEESRKIGQLEAQIAFDKQIQQQLEAQNKKDLIFERKLIQQRWSIYTLGFAFGSLLLIIYLIYNSRKQKEKINQILQAKNVEIESQNNVLKQNNEFIQSQSKKLEKLNNLKDKLFSIISHDLRSPLISLQEMILLLQDNMLNEAEFRNLLSQLLKYVVNISELMDSLLHWANHQMDGVSINFTNVDLQKIVDNLIELLEKPVKDKKIVLKNNLQKPIWVLVDKNMIELVVRNLLSNAIKFCNTGDAINISVWEDDEKVKVMIADTGIGIPKENLAKLFNNQIVTTRGTQGEKGTGLGLILCKDFIEKNGGEIGVESELEKGTVFWFTLPKSKQ